MGYPKTDMITGRPAACEPAIRTLARRQERRKNRARFLVIVPAGAEAPAECYLFKSDHEMRGLTDVVDIYRTRRRDLTTRIVAYCIESGRFADRNGIVVDSLAQVPSGYRAEIEMEVVRYPLPDGDERDELTQLRWLDSPYTLTEDEAFERGDEHLTTEHLYCGVREVHGRWEFYRGLGGHIVVEGVADTREEAEVLAQAHLWRAWLDRVEQIRERRLGDLSWGTPIGCPFITPAEIDDPQAGYQESL